MLKTSSQVSTASGHTSGINAEFRMSFSCFPGILKIWYDKKIIFDSKLTHLLTSDQFHRATSTRYIDRIPGFHKRDIHRSLVLQQWMFFLLLTHQSKPMMDNIVQGSLFHQYHRYCQNCHFGRNILLLWSIDIHRYHHMYLWSALAHFRVFKRFQLIN